MPPNFQGKVICVSGAASGIGFITAKYLYSCGATLSIADIRQDALDAAVLQITDTSSDATAPQDCAKDLQGELQHSRDIRAIAEGADSGVASEKKLEGSERVLAVVTDVRSSAQVDAWVESTVQKFGRLDGAANLAGVVGRGIGTMKLTEMTDKDWDFMTSINLTGVFYAVRAQIRAMEKLGTPAGSIVNAASTAGIEGNAFNADYSAAKHGVVGLSRSAAKEWGDKNIRVNCVAP